MPSSGSLAGPPPAHAHAHDDEGAYDYAELSSAALVAQLQRDVVRLQGAARAPRASHAPRGTRMAPRAQPPRFPWGAGHTPPHPARVLLRRTRAAADPQR
jgi:hypothetical protein